MNPMLARAAEACRAVEAKAKATKRGCPAGSVTFHAGAEAGAADCVLAVEALDGAEGDVAGWADVGADGKAVSVNNQREDAERYARMNNAAHLGNVPHRVEPVFLSPPDALALLKEARAAVVEMARCYENSPFPSLLARIDALLAGRAS